MLRCALLTLLMLAAPVAATPASPTDGGTVTVANLRLPIDEQSWADQREPLLALLQDLQPDVIVVQQVLQTADQPNPACWLANRLRYSCDFVTADPPSQPLRRGSAMLSRHPLIEDGITLLHPPGQYAAAGMLRLQLEEGVVNVYAARLWPDDNTAAARLQQIAGLTNWITATADGLPSMIAGDFSAPADQLVRQMPGFQPARKNPVDPGSNTPAAAAGAGHGLDVLYQVRQFAGISRRPIRLPDSDPDAAPPLGILVTLRLAAPVKAATAESPQP